MTMSDSQVMLNFKNKAILDFPKIAFYYNIAAFIECIEFYV